MSVRGWAIKRNGEIDIATVSATEFGAKCKWLCLTQTGAAWAADQSSRMFDELAPPSIEYPSCIRVNITETP